jgi:transposase-like protein
MRTEDAAMKTSEFRVWLANLFRLSRGQREQVEQALGHQPSPPPLEWLEKTRGGDVGCPRCAAQKPYRWGRQAGMQRFRCRQCSHTFTLLSGTPLARLRHKERWLLYSEALLEGLTVRQAAHRCGIHKNTSFRWRHRFLRLPAETKAEHLQGIAEADETYFPYSCKGQRHLDRPPRQRGHAIHARGTGSEQVPVLIVRDRSGATADFQLTAATTAEIEPPLRAVLAPDAILCSDGASVYRVVAQHLHLTHRPINLSAGIRVIAGVYHVQNVNAYDSRLKGWMRRFHGVATKYLENYLGWRRWLERWGPHNSPQIGIYAALGWERRFQLLTQT